MKNIERILLYLLIGLIIISVVLFLFMYIRRLIKKSDTGSISEAFQERTIGEISREWGLPKPPQPASPVLAYHINYKNEVENMCAENDNVIYVQPFSRLRNVSPDDVGKVAYVRSNLHTDAPNSISLQDSQFNIIDTISTITGDKLGKVIGVCNATMDKSKDKKSKYTCPGGWVVIQSFKDGKIYKVCMTTYGGALLGGLLFGDQKQGIDIK